MVIRRHRKATSLHDIVSTTSEWIKETYFAALRFNSGRDSIDVLLSSGDDCDSVSELRCECTTTANTEQPHVARTACETHATAAPVPDALP